MNSTDKRFLDEIKKRIQSYVETEIDEDLKDIQHPIDKDIVGSLNRINLSTEEEYEIYQHIDTIKIIWSTLIKKAIVCLRYFDKREPFKEHKNKKPIAYGVDELASYFEQYTAFEKVLYGGVKYYRDHVIHVFRVWMLGLNLLLDPEKDYLDKIEIEKGFYVHPLEKLSIWTITSLTHDLGYPLEKSIQIVERTKKMMNSFVQNPIVTMDTSFSGVQNTMNDYVLKFISSKMIEINPSNPHEKKRFDEKEYNKEYKKGIEEFNKFLNKKEYVARLQPKYYFKFQKSLEHNSHGVLSALIVYKLLIYFLESDFSTNEDYIFDYEDARQFYIRRDILRSMASHTCHDVYQNSMLSFSFLLILCDDAQEWGRRCITDLFASKENDYSYKSIDIVLNDVPFKCNFSDKYTVSEYNSVEDILKNFLRQSKTYVCVFRDGQDTQFRDFNFTRQIQIEINEGIGSLEYDVTLEVTADKQSQIKISHTRKNKLEENDKFVSTFKKLVDNTEMTDDKQYVIHELSL